MGEKHSWPHSTVRLSPLGTHRAGGSGSCQGTPSPLHFWQGFVSSGSRTGQGGHLLLVVQFAVELLVTIEAGGLQGLLAGRALDALLVPQAVVQAQQEPVRNDSLAPFTHGLRGRGSACGNDPGQGWVRERWMGRRTGHGMDGGSHSFRFPTQAGGSEEGGGCAGCCSGIRWGPVP